MRSTCKNQGGPPHALNSLKIIKLTKNYKNCCCNNILFIKKKCFYQSLKLSVLYYIYNYKVI